MPYISPGPRSGESRTAAIYNELGAYFAKRCEEHPSLPRNRIRLQKYRMGEPVTVEDWLLPKWARAGKVRNVRVTVYPDGRMVDASSK